MQKDNEKKASPASGESSAQELLRQLRMRYEEGDPEDVFGTQAQSADDAAPSEDAPDEEITRRIMEMFSSTANEDDEHEIVGESSEMLLIPEEDADVDEIEVEVAADTDDQPEIDVDQEPEREAEPEPPQEELDESMPLPEDFEGEVSDAASPDFADVLEEVPAIPTGEDADSAQKVQEEILPEDDTEIIDTDEPAEDEPAAEPPETVNEPRQEAEDEPAPPAPAIEPSQDDEPVVKPPAPTEQPKAALPLSEGEAAVTSQKAEEPAATDEAPAAPQTNAEEALQEGEIILDEFDELPTSAAGRAEEPQPLTEAPTPAPRVEALPKQATPRPSPLDAALSAQRKKHEAEGGRHSNALRAAETLSEEDVLLLLRMGYENELRNKQPAETLQRVEREAAPSPLTDRQRFHLAYGWRESEQGDAPKDAQVKETYRKNAVGVTWRMLLCTLFALACLALDLSPLYFRLLPAGMAEAFSHPSVHLLALQLLVLCAIPSGRRLLYGARQLLCLTPEPCSVVLPVLLCNLAYDVVMTMQEQMYVLLNFPTALLLWLLVVCDAMDLRRERIAFSVVSGGESKTVLSRTQPRKKKVVRGGRIVKIINDDADRVHYNVERTDRVDGYFRRTNEPTVRYRLMLPLLAAQLLLSLGVSGFCTIRTGVTPAALTVLLLSMQLCAPATCLISYAYSLLLACRRLQSRGATIVGQSTVDEMGADKMLIFADTEMLQAKSSTEITIKGSGDPKRYVRYARRLFYALGGTLGKINTSDLSEDRMDGLVEILRIYPEGVEARIDGRVRVLAGSSAFLASNGIRVPATNAELLARRNDESSILYLAFGGQIRLGYEINYRILGSFEQMLAGLSRGRSAVALRSYDPNITEEYLAASRSKRGVPVRVIKPVHHQKSTTVDAVDSGIVATAQTRGVAYAVRMCERMLHNHRMLQRVQWITAFAGAAAAIALTLGGLIDATVSVIAALLMGIFCLPVLMLAGKDLWPEADRAASHESKGGQRTGK